MSSEPRPIPFTTADVERLEAINRGLHELAIVEAAIALGGFIDELMERQFTDIPADLIAASHGDGN